MSCFRMRPKLCYVTFVATFLAASTFSATAFLIQPYNYMLDDSAMLAPQASSHEHNAARLSTDSSNQDAYDSAAGEQSGGDKDIIDLISDGLNRLRNSRMVANEYHNAAGEEAHLSQEMAELINEKQQQQAKDGMIGESVADMLLNAAQAAADTSSQQQSQQAASQVSQADQADQANQAIQSPGDNAAASSRGSIFELDTSRQSMPSKSDLKEPNQWYDPKEIIPALKISSMATPSKYKKVYFRAEKKLVDGAFHQPDGKELSAKKDYFLKPFKGNVQRRSSKAVSHSAAPPIFENGVIDFLKKFREVYVQTRPVQTASGSASSGSTSFASNFASNMLAAASSPAFNAVLAPGSAGGSGKPSSNVAASVANGVANAATGSSSANTIKSPLSAQSYVSFWSKTFPTWVRKMLKQLRRRSLYNSNKRQQQKTHSHQHHNSQAANLIQAAGAIANAGEQSTSSGSSSSSSSSSLKR